VARHTTPARGDRCGSNADCGDQTCLSMPGGYCGGSCANAPCAGACVETMRDGELCLASCTRDGDCRADEGYTCDPQWHACTIPNTTALVPKQCPAAGPARDPAFTDVTPWAIGRSPSAVSQGHGVAGMGVVALYASSTGIGCMAEAAGPVVTGGRDPWVARGTTKLYGVWRDDEAVEFSTEPLNAACEWTPPIPVQETSDPIGKAMVAVGPGEIIYVMYGSGRDGLRVRTSHDGGKTFATAVTALAGTYGNAAVGSDGRLHLVTLNGDDHGAYGSAQQQIEYTVSADKGATFAKAIVVSRRDELVPTYFANPSIAVDDRRKLVYVAYVRGGRDGVWDVVIATTKDAGKTWTRTTIGDGCSMHLVPNLALDPTTGTLHVAWYDTAGAPGRFVHGSCPSGAAKCSVWGAINTEASEPFEPLSTGHGTKAWIGDYASLFVDDKSHVLHALWTQPVTDKTSGKLVPRIYHASAKLRK